MEYRKLISFGKSSYVVSLPKNWVRQNKLNKGDLIYFDEKEDHLVLGFKENVAPEDTSTTIIVDGKSLLHLRRELNGAYIENNREIIFQGKELKEKSEHILEFVRDLIALEVMEFDSTKIITKDFLNMDKVSIKELIKKMDMIVRSMLKDSADCFTNDNSSNIQLRDGDVNRLSFLLYRTVRYGLRSQSKMYKNFGFNAIDLLNFYWITFHLEEIADEVKRISRVMEKLNLSKKHQQQFVQLLKRSEEFYLEMIKSYYLADRNKALELSNWKVPLVDSVNKFSDEANNNTKEFSYLVDRFRKMIGSIHELDRLTYQR